MYSTVTRCTVQLLGVQYSYRVYSTGTGCTVQLPGVQYSCKVYSTVTRCTVSVLVWMMVIIIGISFTRTGSVYKCNDSPTLDQWVSSSWFSPSAWWSGGRPSRSLMRSCSAPPPSSSASGSPAPRRSHPPYPLIDLNVANMYNILYIHIL